MKKLVLLILLLASPAFGADYYIAQSAAGTEDASSCANAKAVTWNWTTPNVTDGDTVHVCGTITSTLAVPVAGTSSSITVKFESGAKFSKTAWGTGASAAIYVNGKNYITIDGGTNGVIECTDNGSTGHGTAQDARAVDAVGSDNLTIKNLTITPMYHRTLGTDSNDMGYAIVVTGGSNISIHDNTISETRNGIDYTTTDNETNIAIYNNTISNVNWGIAIGLLGAATEVGQIDIYNNTINVGTVWGGCWSDCSSGAQFHNNGVHVYLSSGSPVITNFNFYNNKIGPLWGMVHADSSTGYCDPGSESCLPQATGGLFWDFNAATTFKAYNNVLYGDTGYYTNGGFLSGDGTTCGFYNNTVYSPSGGISVAATKNCVLKDNILLGTTFMSSMTADGLPAGTDHGIPTLDYNVVTATSTTVSFTLWKFSYNNQDGTFTAGETISCTSGGTAQYYDVNADPGYFRVYNISGTCASGDQASGASGHVHLTGEGTRVGNAQTTYSDFISKTGQQANGKVGTPTFVNTATYDYRLQSGDTVAKWQGTATGQLGTVDKNGTSWNAPPSIGAYEYGSGTVYAPFLVP